MHQPFAATLQVSGSTIYRTKRRLVEANLEGALNEEPRATTVGNFERAQGNLEKKIIL